MPAKMKDGPVRALATQLEQLYTQVLCHRLLFMRGVSFCPVQCVAACAAVAVLTGLESFNTFLLSQLSIACWSSLSLVLKVTHLNLFAAP